MPRKVRCSFSFVLLAVLFVVGLPSAAEQSVWIRVVGDIGYQFSFYADGDFILNICSANPWR